MKFPEETFARLLLVTRTLGRGDVTPELLEAAYKAGLMKKEQLQDGQYYVGSCRNASVAKWCLDENCFKYRRYKWGSHYVEPIYHPADFNGFDVFVALEECTPTEEQKI